MEPLFYLALVVDLAVPESKVRVLNLVATFRQSGHEGISYIYGKSEGYLKKSMLVY